MLHCCAQARSRGGHCHRWGGRQTLAELVYTSLMRGDRRHSLPPPIFLSLHTHTNIHILSYCSPCLSHLDHFILFKSATCRGLKNRTQPPTEHYHTKILGTRTGPMYYSNDSQGTLSIFYVDFLIMARKKGSSKDLDFLSCQQTRISTAHSF